MSGALCSYTMLALVNWSEVTAQLSREVMRNTLSKEEFERYLSLRNQLGDIMNNGETYFTSDDDEYNFFSDLFNFVTRR